MARRRSEQIRQALLSWPGVEAYPHRFGGEEYRLGRREIGHVHGQSLVDVPLPRRMRDEFLASGKARPHHVLPESGWVSVPMKSDRDVAAALEVLQAAYRSALEQRRKRGDPG
jgi:hypothetical protein